MKRTKSGPPRAGAALQLTNDGGLDLFFLGVGSAFSKRHYQTNLLVVKGKDHLMVDFGTNAARALSELEVPVTALETFLITHLHADHIGGLEEVMLTNRYVARKKASIIITPEFQRALWGMSLRGGCAFNEEPHLRFTDFWKVRRPRALEGYPRESYEYQLGSINLKLFRTRHIPDSAASWDQAAWSCGVVIDERVLFTADTLFDRELLDSFNRLFRPELIIHDCQFFTGGVHASLAELRTLPRTMRRKMLLVHYGDNWEQFHEQVQAAGFLGLARQWHHYRP